MDVLIIVNESPWGSSLASTALRFANAVLETGNRVPAVFFQHDGIYNALGGRAADDGLTAPFEAWGEIARNGGTQLMLCSAAAARRLDQFVADRLPDTFQEAGLVQMWELAQACDRVVTF